MKVITDVGIDLRYFIRSCISSSYERIVEKLEYENNVDDSYLPIGDANSTKT